MRALALILLSTTAALAEPTIKPADVAATLDTALAVVVDVKTPRAVATVVARIEKADANDIRTVRAAIAKLPLTILEERTQSGVEVISVAAKSGARGTITIGADGGAITVTLRPAAIKPPGACVAIPQVKHHVSLHASGVNQSGERNSRTIEWALDTTRLLDVDGDGLLDAFVPVAPNPSSCPELVSYRIYVVRGTCGHEVGVVGPGSPSPDASKVPLAATGFRPITMSSQTAGFGQQHGIPQMTTKTRRFEVANNRYRQVDIKSSTGDCHHCSTWHCNKR